MKFLKKGNTLRAFTLAELVVAVIIGSLILSILMSFIASSMNEITYSNSQTAIIEKINNFSTTVNNYKGTFGAADVLIDNTGSGSDVVMMTNPEETEGIIVGVVAPSTMELEQSSGDYETIYEKFIGIRLLTAADITNLNATPSDVYALKFNDDKLFRNLVMKDFQAERYNTGSVIDMDLAILINYKDGIDGERWDSVTNDWIYKINMNF